MKLSTLLPTLAVVTLGLCATAQAQTLTDIVLFRLDGANNTVNEGWNTRGGETQISNLYLLSGGSFVNSGNGAGTSIALDLSAPGQYTFEFAGENVNNNVSTALGINFFFDSSTTPGISARGTLATNNGGSFVANGNITNNQTFANVPGANTLAFTTGGQTVTLSEFSYNTNSAANRVTSFDNASGGTPDTIGSFTLTVAGASAAAPEPSGLALLLPAVVGRVWYRRRQYA